ncbi:MAG: IS3 family transposase [Collinsella sp.]|nr:IS3 family transposase [Collinsella sp.]
MEWKDYKTREEAAQGIFKHIELYYNTVRMHSALDYDSPVDYERRCT